MRPYSHTYERPEIQIGLLGKWADPLEKFVEDVAGHVTKTWKGNVLPTLRSLPGGKAVEDAVNQGADWVKAVIDFPVLGDILLAFLAWYSFGHVAMALGGIAWFGPQLASAVWALPGVVRGKKFFDSWASAVVTRTEKLAEYYGADIAKQAMGYMPDAFRYLGLQASLLPGSLTMDQALKVLKITPEELAQALNIRVDLAALVLMYVKEDLNLYDMSKFDVKDPHGRRPGFMTSFGDAYTSNFYGNKASKFYLIEKKRLPGGRSWMDVVRPKQELTFLPNPNGSNRAPVGQILLLAFLTAPAWALMIWRR
jgi:hypothetical protein